METARPLTDSPPLLLPLILGRLEIGKAANHFLYYRMLWEFLLGLCTRAGLRETSEEMAGARIALREHVVVSSEGGAAWKTGVPGWAVKVGVEVRSHTSIAHVCSPPRLTGPRRLGSRCR